MVWLIEAILSIGTLGGYWMITHGLIQWGAFIGLASNILWLFYGYNGKSASIFIVNFVFAIINISLLNA